MAHPYAGHKENAVAHRRANKIVHGNEYARGGAVKEAKAGKVTTGGAESGVGRLQKAGLRTSGAKK